MDIPSEPKPGNEIRITEEFLDNFTVNVLSSFIEADEKVGFSSINEEPEFEMDSSPEMDFPPKPELGNEIKCIEESSDNITMNVISAFIENDAKPGFSSGNEEPESKMDLLPEMDLPPEPKPGGGTKGIEESSDNISVNVISAFIEKDAKPEFLSKNEEPESEMDLSPEMDLPHEPKPGKSTKSIEESSDNTTMNVLSAFIGKNAKPEFFSKNDEPESEMDLSPETTGNGTKCIEETSHDITMNVQSTFIEKDAKPKFFSENKEPESEMDLTPEMNLSTQPKPGGGTKGIEESSHNISMNNAASAFNERDTKLGFSSGNKEPESQHLENKDEGKFSPEIKSSLLEHFDSGSQEKQNKTNVTKYIKSDDKIDSQRKYFTNGLEDKEMLEMENDFQQNINLQDDVSTDSSNASSSDNSSGIEKDFEMHEDYNGIIIKNEGEIEDKIFEDSLANHFCNTDNSSSKKDAELSEKLGCERKRQDKLNLKNTNLDSILKKAEGELSACNSAPTFDTIKFPYKDPSNAFEVVVPLIGKNVMSFGDIKPFNQRYDLAKEINRLKGLEDAPFMPKLGYQEWRKQRDARPQEEKDREEKKEKYIAIKTAVYIIKISIIILQEMQKEKPDEQTIEGWLIRFLRLPASPLSLLLATQFVHLIMFIRGSSDFSLRIRYVADKCYWKCHVMFPIPEGYNFETVYTSEVVKNIPQRLNGMRNYVLEYGDFECPVSESDDSAFSESDDNQET